MDASDKSTPDLLGAIKSWLPKRSDPAHVSRDFWMPDHSCLVCYECDSQFTLFNRRHHCRLCGRVFCAKCTSNFIPVTPSDQSTTGEEKIRVCNFCFKQREQNLASGNDHAIQPSGSEISVCSPSVRSLVSTRSSGTLNSGSATFISGSLLAGVIPLQSEVMEISLDRQDVTKELSNDCASNLMYHDESPNRYRYCMNRSDDDDEDFGEYPSGTQSSQYSQINGYYENLPFDEIESDYESRKVHPDSDIDSKGTSCTPLHNSFASRGAEEVQQILKEEVVPDGKEGEPTSSDYVAESVDTEPVDFENNGVLWLPPEPEDEEDEREATLFDDDDDDGDATGEWRQLPTSSSFGSGEFRSRDRSNEEHKKATKNVVDGHFRALVAQLLQVENLPVGEEGDKESWLEIITSLSWEGATLLKPDTSKGGGMDPGGYVKIKCLASGRCSDSTVVKGIVCKKNVAHRRMTSNLEKPRILILGGALEYQRVTNLLSSFDTLLQQEMDHLKMAVAKIDSHHPDILLVEKSVSRYAQEYLLAKDISLVLNIKRPLLERIARCTGGQIVPSIDHLSTQKLGYCDQVYVKRSLEEHGTAGQDGKKLVKTLMYFEGCPKPLGCTVLLRGANGDELKKVKHVVQYGIFAAYHLALETSFLADEGASLPQLPLATPINVALPDKTSSIDRSISTIPGFTIPVNGKSLGGQSRRTQSDASSLMTAATGGPTLYANPSVSSSGHNLSHSYLDKHSPCESGEPIVNHHNFRGASSSLTDTVQLPNNFAHSDAIEEKEVFGTLGNDCSEGDASRACTELSSTQVDEKQAHEEPVSLKEEFPPSPSDHQSILVSLSSRCVWKGTVCERSHLFRIKYYSNFDKPLGRYLCDHLFDQSYRCRFCEMPSEAHVQCYTHRQGTLTISVKKLPEILLPGEKDSRIWMWHRCLRCPRINGFPPATRRIVMSDAAWGLSLGKFLELSFSNHAAASRVASCGHSLHRDCLRFYGFGKMVACFRYASIDVHSVYLPPSKLDFNFENQDWIQKELNKVVGKAALMFSDVVNGLRKVVDNSIGQLSNDMKISKASCQIADLEIMLQKEKDDFEKLVENIQNREMRKGQPVLDILEINGLRRQLLFQSYMWDHRLQHAATLDNKPLQDDIDVKLPESAKRSLGNKKLGDQDTVAGPANTLSNQNSDAGSVNNSSGIDIVPVDSNGNETHYQRVRVNYTNQEEEPHGRNINDNPLASLSGISISAESNPMDSDITVRRTLSDGQYSNAASLSQSLDAAWTGENQTAVGIVKDDISPTYETTERDSSTAGGMAEKLFVEDQVTELTGSKVFQLPSLLSFKSSDNTEDTLGWLGMPFVSFYRSFNKSLSGNVQKLEKINGYNPVYISSFWESEEKGGSRFMFPVGLNDTVVPVYDDEPTSIISYALLSPAYLVQLSDETERSNYSIDSMGSQSIDPGSLHFSQSADEAVLQSYRSLVGDESFMSTGSRNSAILDLHSYHKTLHARVLIDHPLGEVKYNVTCYFAKRFEALRKICCPSEMDFVRSLSRCKKWGAQGGKSNVFFAKTLDERFIIKQVTKTELESFLKFAPEYFKYLSESIASGSPTCLAKIMGIYQVTTKNAKGGKELLKMDVLVMENLLFGRNLTRLYDLKGSSRSRYNPDSSGSNKVLLDQNLIEAMPTSPIFVGNKAKRLLERAVWNDTAFLASVDVMDYSLLVGIDEEKHELVLGIIDFMRQYTWDKHLETWVKASGILGGPKNASPTVISPKQYKKRFRKAMTTYFLMVPDQWSPPTIIPSKSTELAEENTQGGILSTE
ncbi:kinase [Lithospermum erythrorhizon]|uniref:1-phosphatidylinositol-3-phosphate 5-kinase n=1 Tax=Lithospermum erythrorhizon TaxID=34254 RepID=A0AAV3NQI1_LITER